MRPIPATVTALAVLASLLPAIAVADPALDYASLAAFLRAYQQVRSTGQYLEDADLHPDAEINLLDCIRAVQDALESEPKVGPDGTVLVWVSPGEFMMGSEDGASREQPVHRVRITRGFYLAKHEVTNAQYAAFLNAHGSIYDDEGLTMIHPEVDSCKVQQVDGIWQAAPGGWANNPVFDVTWYGAKAYCDHYGLRLPTEAEWEYAARGAEGRRYPWGDTWDESKCVNGYNQGWWEGVPRTYGVGSFPAGDSWCGASDMAGNVWEWCADWCGSSYYSVSPLNDPTGPAMGDYRIFRGGSWDDGGDYCRAAHRGYTLTKDSHPRGGFRTVSP